MLPPLSHPTHAERNGDLGLELRVVCGVVALTRFLHDVVSDRHPIRTDMDIWNTLRWVRIQKETTRKQMKRDTRGTYGY